VFHYILSLNLLLYRIHGLKDSFDYVRKHKITAPTTRFVSCETVNQVKFSFTPQRDASCGPFTRQVGADCDIRVKGRWFETAASGRTADGSKAAAQSTLQPQVFV
jgi:hypothetical protein